MPADKPRLTPKQKRFVEEYVADGNAVQAYFKAFGRKNAKGIRRSYSGTNQSAMRLLQNATVRAEITQAEEEYAKAVRVSKQRVLREVATLAFASQNDIFERGVNGEPVARDWDDISTSTKRAIQSIKIKRRTITLKDGNKETNEEIEFKLHPKGAELDKLCKKLGFYASEATIVGTGEVMVFRIPDNGRDAVAEVKPDVIKGEQDDNDDI